MAYQKIGGKYERKYGMKRLVLSKYLNVTPETITSWEKKGINIFDKAKDLHIFYNKIKLARVFCNIKHRCNNETDKKYRNYGGKGIRALLTKSDLLKLWNRDKAHLMKRPSIDRKDTDKDYVFKNCRFIEMEENIKRRKYVK